MRSIFHKFILFIFFLSSMSYGAVLSGLDNPSLNTAVGELLEIQYNDGKKIEPLPIVFTVPYSKFMDLNQITPEGAIDLEDKKNDILIFDYVQPSPESQASKTGLKLFLAESDQGSRKKLSKKLADSGLLQTGDVILSFRNEWAGTAPYSHIQLGISHSGMVFIDSEGYARNIDMPLDHLYIHGPKNSGKSYISSEHYTEKTSGNKKPYLEAPLLHIVRPKNLTLEQKKNLEAWANTTMDDALKGKLYKDKIWFNKDYQDPVFNDFNGDTTQQIFDLARVIQRKPVQGNYKKSFSMYCSEFVWSLLSLRNCSMEDDFSHSDAKPECISPIFEPLPVVGSYLMNTAAVNATPGLVDGPLIVLGEAGSRVQTIEQDLNDIFSNRVPVNEMSGGHEAVMNSIPPQLLLALRYYYKVSYFENMEKNVVLTEKERAIILADKTETLKAVNLEFMKLPEDQKAGIRKALQKPEGAPIEVTDATQIAQIFNTMNRIKNYSPASFMIQALLPEAHNQKAFDYIGTLAIVNKAGDKKIKESLR